MPWPGRKELVKEQKAGKKEEKEEEKMPESVLEFKAQDGAWYAGMAEFEGPYLRVHFEHFPEGDDEKWLPQDFKTLQDVKKMIRPASQPMQDSQCSGLRRGVYLCVACRRSGIETFEYYDAKLQQFHRSPHKRLPDGQERCECEFEVEWLSGPLLNKRQFVKCGDICLRTPGDIEDDPVIKDYVAEVLSLKVCKSLGSIDTSEKDASLLIRKRKMVSADDERVQQAIEEDAKERIVSGIDQKDVNITLQCGESSKQIGDINTACTYVEPPLKKAHVNTPPAAGSKIPEPSFSCGAGSARVYTDVIQIDSDKEEEPGGLKNDLAAKITEAFCHAKVNEGRKSNDDKTVKDDQKIQAISPIAKLLEEMSARDSSGISKECPFSGSGNVAGYSCLAVPNHCFKNKSCECEALGFIPISSCHLTNMCSHSHRKCKHSSRRSRKSGHDCAFSATSQVCSQADNALHSQVCEAGGDTNKESVKDNSCEGTKGLYDYLLVENLEKDILPSRALKAVRKVSSGAITVQIWPSMEYETTRRGYIFYQDSKSAEAAYLQFSAGKFIVTSPKGRPWLIRRHKLDRNQPYDISAVLKEENKEAGKEEVEDKDLLIIYKGAEEYTKAIGKQTLFKVQQEKLRCCHNMFINEEKDLEALTWH